MAELTPSERLQPSLLDRLTDENPNSQSESSRQRVLSVGQLRKGVLRDLSWLLNTGSLDDVQSLTSYPEVEKSVINYGMPDLTGVAASSVDTVSLERRIRQAIQAYEPRILSNTLKVRMVVSEEEMNRNALTFDIEGEMWAQPLPLHVILQSELDLESGRISVSDMSGSV